MSPTSHFRAYILIETSVAQTGLVAEALRKLEVVTSVHKVTAPYDIVAFLEAIDPSTVGEAVIEKIRPIEGITRTLTCVVLD